MPITIRTHHTLDAAEVAAVISAHYKAMNVPVEPSQITHQVFEGGSGGYSSSGPRLGDTTIRFFGKKPVGMPDSMTLKPLQVQEIVAVFLNDELGLRLRPEDVTLEVSGHSGSGFSQSRAQLTRASVRVQRRV